MEYVGADGAVYTLNSEQECAVKYACKQYNLFITGSGGNGKSIVFQKIVEELRAKNIVVWVTAPTGVAAKNIDGITLHDFLGCGLAEEPVEELLVKLRKKYMTKTRQRLSKRRSALMIDEISMVHPTFLRKIDLILQDLCNDKNPFGGWQVIFVGDMLQLKPVDKDNMLPPDETFVCQMEPLWSNTIDKIILLRQSMRQKDDRVYADLLSNARFGELTGEDVKLLKSRVKAPFPDDGVKPTMLVPHRKTAEDINNRHLQQLDATTELVFRSSTTYRCPVKRNEEDTEEEMPDLSEYDLKHLDEMCAKMAKDTIAPNTLALRIGAQVVLVKNMKEAVLQSGIGAGKDGEDEMVAVSLVNGSRGVVTSMTGDTDAFGGASVMVKFIDVDEPVRIRVHEWAKRDRRTRREIVYQQIPLALAWAWTIHKAQAMTLDRVVTSIDDKVFEEGQAYVALSRVRNLASLSLSKFQPEGIFANAAMVAFYKKMEATLNASARAAAGTTGTKRARPSYGSSSNGLVTAHDDEDDGMPAKKMKMGERNAIAIRAAAALNSEGDNKVIKDLKPRLMGLMQRL